MDSKKAVAQRCFIKKVFFEISQNSQENICARVSFLIKLQDKASNFIKKNSLFFLSLFSFRCTWSKVEVKRTKNL